MRRQRKPFVIAGFLLLGGAVSLVAWTRLNTVSEASNPTEFWRREGARAYSEFRVAPVGSPGPFVASLAATRIDDPEARVSDDDPRVAALREVVESFLLHRYTAETREEYVDWMESRGYRLKTREEFEPRYGPLAHNAARAGFDGTEVDGVFGALWTHPPSERAVPKTLAIGEGAIAIEIASGNHNRRFTGRLRGVLGEQLWHGGSSSSCRFWMQAPVTREHLVEQHGEVLAAQAGVIGEAADGGRRPIIMHLFYDPGRDTWWIDAVSVTNYTGSNETWTCCEY